MARANPFPTPAVSVGVYDWVIAHDQVREQSWLISWGLKRHEDHFEPDASRALQRQRQVMQVLEREAPTLSWQVTSASQNASGSDDPSDSGAQRMERL